ncbi:hypothetical protein OGATHE_005441 [Ogataea polymorpha]|uniref:Uncharacterized protein n=1 Tax=Ogataea polymorpha TaxID=460523 RepID=A0A9P8NWE6_9ASCO|nr:hypothetical protein OGATHE_005441 [Ogataea polymorpha]
MTFKRVSCEDGSEDRVSSRCLAKRQQKIEPTPRGPKWPIKSASFQSRMSGVMCCKNNIAGILERNTKTTPRATNSLAYGENSFHGRIEPTPSFDPDSAWIRFLTSARIRSANLLLPTIAAARTGSVATNVDPTSSESLKLRPTLRKISHTNSESMSQPYIMAPKRTKLSDLICFHIYLGGSSAPVANNWMTSMSLESSKVRLSTLSVQRDGLNQLRTCGPTTEPKKVPTIASPMKSCSLNTRETREKITETAPIKTYAMCACVGSS